MTYKEKFPTIERYAVYEAKRQLLKSEKECNYYVDGVGFRNLITYDKIHFNSDMYLTLSRHYAHLSELLKIINGGDIPILFYVAYDNLKDKEFDERK